MSVGNGRFALVFGGLLSVALSASITRVVPVAIEFIALAGLALVSLSRVSFGAVTAISFGNACLAWGLGLHWLPSALVEFGSLGHGGSFVAWGVTTIVQAAPFGIVAGLSSRSRSQIRFVLTFSTLYAAAEVAWPWLAPFSVSVSLAPSLCGQILPWVGRGGLAWLAGLFISSIAWSAMRQQHFAWRRLSVLAGLIALPLVPALTPLCTSQTIDTFLVQLDTEVHESRRRPDAIASRYGAHTRTALSRNGRSAPRLIFWGESSSPAIASARWHLTGVRRFVGEESPPILFGATIEDVHDRAPTNSILVSDRCESCRYDKGRLVPFAERVPGMVRRFSPGRDTFRSKPTAEVLSAAGVRIGSLICYEAMFPDAWEEAVRAGASLMFNPVNDRWVPVNHAREAHRDLSFLASVEAGMPTVRIVNGGPSEVWSGANTVTTQIAEGLQGAFPAEVPLSSVAPFAAWLRGGIRFGLGSFTVMLLLEMLAFRYVLSEKSRRNVRALFRRNGTPRAG